MWYYASVLPYTYLLYKNDKPTQKILGDFYSERLLQAVRHNKKCDNNPFALTALIEYYLHADSLPIAESLIDEYFALTNDSISYYGYRFALNEWYKKDYTSAAEAADIANLYDSTTLGSWYSEYCLTPARVYALAGRSENAIQQLDLFNTYMRKEIGKQWDKRSIRVSFLSHQ